MINACKSIEAENQLQERKVGQQQTQALCEEK